MANDDEKTKVEANGAEGDGKNEASAKKSGGSKKLIMFGIIGVGAIAIGIVLALFVLKPMMSNSNDGEAGQNTEIAASDQKKADTNGEKKKSKKEKKKKKKRNSEEGGEESYIGTVKDIVINPAGTGGSRFLSVSFGFELESPEAEATFEAREPAIRDALITILSSKTVAQLTDPKQKEILRYQIKRRVSKLMETDELAGVYYTDFVLQ